MTSGPPFSALARAVAQGSPAADLVPELHREALALSGGATSVILERSDRTGDYMATSGRGFPTLAGRWLSGAEARALEGLAAGGVSQCDLTTLPTLADRLGARSALVIPVAGASPAFLVIGGVFFDDRAAELASRAQLEFGLALELARLARQAELHQKLQELFLRFSRGVAATLSLGAALEALAQETNALFGTRRTRIWLHDRRPRELVLAAASDGTSATLGERVPTDSETPAARGLRRDRPEAIVEGGETLLVVPLRGWRRALGTLVLEGTPHDLDDRQFEQAAHELGRQLSVSVENVQLLDEVLQHRRLLEDTFDALVDLVVVVDNNLKVVQTNEAFSARVGEPRTALLDRPLSELVSDELTRWMADDDRGSRGRRARVAARAARTQQFTDARLNGTFSATVTPLINQDRLPVGRVLVARDITTQLKLEREREALRERLGQSEKLASLGQFVAGIAHEMNNPLQGVLGHLELLMETAPAAKPLRRDLRRIYLEGDRAAKIVRNLLVFAGKRRAAQERVRVDRIVSRAIAGHNAVLRRAGIQVVRQQDPAVVPLALGDAMLLQQAFLNVIVNAGHAIAGTGAPGRIEIAIEQSAGAIVTRIRDTGPGIAPDVLPRIFDPFFTTKDVGQGTGLGLAIVYGIVQEHGGTIAARNVPDGGAEFTITLPAFKV